MAVVGLVLGTPALAQDAAQTTTNTPATDSVGPRELQNFSLPGTVTRPADPPPQRTAAPADRTGTPARATTAPPGTKTTAATPAQRTPPEREASPAPMRTSAADAPRASSSADSLGSRSSVTVQLPPVTASAANSTDTATTFADETAAAPFLAPEGGLPVWPWLLAAMALGAAAAFLFWRNRSRAAYAGGPHVDAFVAPDRPRRSPAPAPAPPPAAPKPDASSSPGLVTTRLRPWIDLGLEPVRCIVEDDGVLLEFELELFNSGSAPARDILIEAVMLNAGPTQEQEIGAFFARTDGEGGRMPVIDPLKRVRLRRQVGLSLDQVRVLKAGDRKVFVPLIAFNLLYSWGGGIGHTSAVYLVGRETKGEKMAPFRIDLGRRVFRGVAARSLPQAVRN